MARGIAGEVGDLLVLTMKVDEAWTDCTIGDLCAHDTTAAHDLVVCDTVNDTPPFGRIVALSPGANATTIAAGLIYATVEIFYYHALRGLPTTGTIAVGANGKIDGGSAVDLETDTIGAAKPLCVVGCTGASTAYFLI